MYWDFISDIYNRRYELMSQLYIHRILFTEFISNTVIIGYQSYTHEYQVKSWMFKWLQDNFMNIFNRSLNISTGKKKRFQWWIFFLTERKYVWHENVPWIIDKR